MWIHSSQSTHNINANESDQNTLARKIIHWYSYTNNSNNKLADAHANSTEKEEIAATKAFHAPNARKSHENIDNICRDTDKEAVLDARVLEERCSIIENKVD